MTVTSDRALTLTYRVSGTPKIDTYENSAFRVEIHDHLATFRLKRELGTLDAAEQVIGEFLRSFEADQLFQGTQRVTFTFEGGQMKSGVGKFVGLHFTVAVNGPLSETNIREQSPWRRPGVAATPDAGALLKRYEEYKAGREKLSTVAYVTLSALQERAGGRAKAATNYCVHRDVLDRVAKLSSDHGDLASARKLEKGSSKRPLSGVETFWLEAATRALIIRMHQVEAGAHHLREIDMADLPN